MKLSLKKNTGLCFVKFAFIVTVIRSLFNSNKRIKPREYATFAWCLVPKCLPHKLGMNVVTASSVRLKDHNNMLLANI